MVDSLPDRLVFPPHLQTESLKNIKTLTFAGLWIDHRKAMLVLLSPQGEKTIEILSHVDKQLGRYDGVRSTTRYAQEVPADDSHEREFDGDLGKFYDEVIAAFLAAGAATESVLIFGPGEAKGELKKRWEKRQPGTSLLAMETDDKMTDRQIIAKVREHFHNQLPRV